MKEIKRPTLEILKKAKRLSSFEIFIEVLGWLQIVASPLLIASIIGLIIYFTNPSASRLFIAIIFIFIGLMIGIVWATKKWRKNGTMQFLSRISATPELDQHDEAIK